MIFIENKYTKIYYSIIDSAKSRTLSQETYTEKHHTIPKSLGGDNTKLNLVKLTAREHFICHWLLTKMTADTAHIKMVYALHRMQGISKYHQRYTSKITSRVFAKLRIEHSQCISRMNKGKTLTPEHIQKVATSMIGKNLGKRRTLEHRAAQSIRKTGVKRAPFTEEHKLNISLNTKNKKRKPFTEEQKQKMSESIQLWWNQRRSV
jgi:hypothetical protein